MSATSNKMPRKSTKREKVVVRIVVVVLLFLIGGGIIKRIQNKLPPGVATMELSDGTVLVVRAALFSKQSEFEVPRPTFGVTTPFGRKDTLLRSSRDVGVRFALSRHDPTTGDYLDLPWFSHIETTDFWDGTVRTWPKRVTVHRLNDGRQKSKSGPPLVGDNISRSEGYRILTCSMYRFEAAKQTAEFRVVDVAGETLATFELPLPAKYVGVEREGQHQTTAKLRDVSVELESMKVVGGGTVLNDRVSDEAGFNPQYSVQSDGQELDRRDWRDSDMVLLDDAGNVLRMGGPPLPDAQPNWILRFTLYRRQSAGFNEYKKEKVCSVVIPETGSQQGVVSANSFVTSVTLVGAGSQSVGIPNSLFGGGTRDRNRFPWLCGTRPNTGDYRVSSNGEGGDSGENWKRHMAFSTHPFTNQGVQTPGVWASLSANWASESRQTMITTNCAYPLVVLTTEQFPDDEALNLVAVDDQGRTVRVHPVIHVFRRMPAYALEIFDDSRSVELYLVRQRGRYVELPIVPPTRGLQLSRPPTATAGRKIVTHEGSGSFTTYGGGRGTGIHYTLEPTKDGWRVVEKSTW